MEMQEENQDWSSVFHPIRGGGSVKTVRFPCTLGFRRRHRSPAGHRRPGPAPAMFDLVGRDELGHAHPSTHSFAHPGGGPTENVVHLNRCLTLVRLTDRGSLAIVSFEGTAR